MNQTLSPDNRIIARSGTRRLQGAPTFKPRKRLDLVVHEMDGEALVFDKMTADTHKLNATALFVWNACDGSKQAMQIANELSIIYDVCKADAQTHVEQTIDRLVERQLVII